jgi:hypothetical protein
MHDWTSAPVGPMLRAGLSLAQRLTQRPQSVDAAFVGQLRESGLSTEHIERVALTAFLFAIINRGADAFDFPIYEGAQADLMAATLDRVGGALRVPGFSPTWARGSDGILRPAGACTARERLISVKGVVPAELRRDIEAFAAGLWGAERPEVTLPPEIDNYIGRVTAYPFGLDDAAIDGLRLAGYDDEGIYELTLAAAIGTACAVVEPLYEVLYGHLCDGEG